MDPDQVYGVLSHFYYADAICWVINCSASDTQAKDASASTSEASAGSCNLPATHMNNLYTWRLDPLTQRRHS
jgi:hypothetical protein